MPADDRFDALFGTCDDPWRYASSGYEARKRAMTLAALPRPRFRRGFEPGCANGVLSVALAERCDALVAADLSASAIALATARVGDRAGVRLDLGRIPAYWPDGQFDLVVVSEIAYYLSGSELDAVAARIRDSLAEDGVVVACHWRHPIGDALLTADAVHRCLADRLRLPRLVSVSDRDFQLDVWSRDGRSVAQREGLVPVAGADAHRARPVMPHPECSL